LSDPENDYVDAFGNLALCIKMGSAGTPNECKPLLWDGLTCPGGVAEYEVCYGAPSAAPPPPPEPTNSVPATDAYFCGRDKRGKWRDKKCKKKQAKGKCSQKKVKKKCKATCPSCTESKGARE